MCKPIANPRPSVMVSPFPRCCGDMIYSSCLLVSWQALSPSCPPHSARKYWADSAQVPYNTYNIQAILVRVIDKEPEAPLRSSSRSLGPYCPVLLHWHRRRDLLALPPPRHRAPRRALSTAHVPPYALHSAICRRSVHGHLYMNILSRYQQPAFPWADREAVNPLANIMLSSLIKATAATLRYVLYRPPPFRAPSHVYVTAHGMVDTLRAAHKKRHGLSFIVSAAFPPRLDYGTCYRRQPRGGLSRTAPPVVRMPPHGGARAAPLRLVGVPGRVTVLRAPQPNIQVDIGKQDEISL